MGVGCPDARSSAAPSLRGLAAIGLGGRRHRGLRHADEGQKGDSARRVAPPTGLRPFPASSRRHRHLPKIEHIVVLMMENHSFDDHLGTLGRGDGLTLGPTGDRSTTTRIRPAGTSSRFTIPTPAASRHEITQSWDASHISLDNGTNMGFVKGCGPASMGYWNADDLPFYDSMARQFPSATATSVRHGTDLSQPPIPHRGTALGNVTTDVTGVSSTDAPTARSSTASTITASAGRTTTPTLPPAPSSSRIFLDNYRRQSRPFRAVLHRCRVGQPPAFNLVDPYVNFSEEDDDISVGEALRRHG